MSGRTKVKIAIIVLCLLALLFLGARTAMRYSDARTVAFRLDPVTASFSKYPGRDLCFASWGHAQEWSMTGLFDKADGFAVAEVECAKVLDKIPENQRN